MNYRKEILDYLIPYFQKDERYYLLILDCGFASIDKLKELFPNRIINMGIAEQNTVSVAQGMAMEGLKPVVFSIVNFLVMRSFEQVRNGVNQDLNIKYIGTGAEDYFKFLGKSHTCGQDDIKLMELAGVNVYNPYNPPEWVAAEGGIMTKGQVQFSRIVMDWLEDKKSSYIRV